MNIEQDDGMSTEGQLLNNISYDESVTFRYFRGLLSIERKKCLEDGRILTCSRVVIRGQVATSRLDILGRLLWETAIEVRL